MNLSYREFYESSKAVVKALNEEVPYDNENDDGAFSNLLSRWEVKRSSSNNDTDDEIICYLDHPPITVVVCTAHSTIKEYVGVNQEEDILDIADFEDDTILHDVDAYCGCNSTAITTAAATGTGKESTLPTTTTNLQWNFSIVYSDTYEVPVLYFTVQDCDTGNPCGRQKVLDCLITNQKQDGINDDEEEQYIGHVDTWEFISQEQHPILNVPSYFLHPCQSSQRLYLLLQAAEESCPDNDIDNNMNTSRQKTMHAIVWIWMAMILPAVNHPIPPSYFKVIQDKIVLSDS
jgi:hypothetical protein